MVNIDGFINRKALRKIIFADSKSLKQVNHLFKLPVLTLLRKKIRSLKGLILIESALLIEMDLTFICNHEVVILSIDPQEQTSRLLERGYDEMQISQKLNHQFSYEEKVARMQSVISKSYTGMIYTPDELASLFVADLEVV